ncbi:MAG: response regulator [Oligoflexia bacterium]|nr:response regulator [Oligoflexia bacterium]
MSPHTKSSSSVLLIEDDRGIAEVLQVALELGGYSAFWAKDGQEGLKLVEEIDPDVIICDMMMPVLDGFGFLNAYRANGRTRRAPVIAVTAMRNYLEPARKCGAAVALEKPVDLDKLLETVERVGAGKPPREPAAPTPVEKESRDNELARAEALRLRVVREMGLERPRPDPVLDTFVNYVARVFDVPICMISIVGEKEQRFSVACGLSGAVEETRSGPSQESFCTHAVSARAALIVSDSESNPFFAKNPWVTEYGLRFYAGVPLIIGTPQGATAAGTLCLIDLRPRNFGFLDLELLSVFGKRVVAEFEWRELRRRSAGNPDVLRRDGSLGQSQFPDLNYIDPELGVVGRQGFLDVLRLQMLRNAERHLGTTLIGMAIPPEAMKTSIGAIQSEYPLGWVGKLATDKLGLMLSGISSEEARRRLLGLLPAPVEVEAEEGRSRVGDPEKWLSLLESRLELGGRQQAA